MPTALSLREPAGATSFGYDSINNPVSVSAPAGAQNTLAYTDSRHPHQPTQATDPQGNTTSLAYDTKGNLTTETDALPSQNQVAISYNADGTVSQSQDPKTSATAYAYDARGNVVGVTPPAPLGPTKATYDDLNRPASITDGEGRPTAYTYDALDRVTKVTPADNSPITIAYDPDGYVTSVIDRTGTATMTYDAQGRLVSRTTPEGTVSQRYDLAGNLSELRAAGLIWTYLYNAVNLATSASGSISDPTGTISLGTIAFTYDASYHRTSVAYPGGVTQTSTYDSSGRLSSTAAIGADGRTLYQTSYSFADPTGKDTALRTSDNGTDTRAGQGGEDPTQYWGSGTYRYDAANRLSSSTMTRARGLKGIVTAYSTTTTDAYTYDGAGNRVRLDHTVDIHNPAISPQSVPSTTRYTYAYNDANQLMSMDVPSLGTRTLMGTHSSTFAYDPDGNLTSSGGHDPGGSPAADAVGESFDYNALDQTTYTKTASGSGVYTYRGTGQAERISAGPARGVATTTFLHTPLGLTVQTDAGVSSYVLRDPGGGLLGWRNSKGTYFYLTDALGSVVGMTDSSGRLVARYDYSPFGDLSSVWTPTQVIQDSLFAPHWEEPTQGVTSAENADEVVARANPYRYAGAYLDATGMYQMGERYYDPTLGRFTQQDPVQNALDPKQWNRYVYVGDDPVNFVDPIGKSACTGGWTGFFTGIDIIGAFLKGAAFGGGIAFFIGTIFRLSGGVVFAIVAGAMYIIGVVSAIAERNSICNR